MIPSTVYESAGATGGTLFLAAGVLTDAMPWGAGLFICVSWIGYRIFSRYLSHLERMAEIQRPGG